MIDKIIEFFMSYQCNKGLFLKIMDSSKEHKNFFDGEKDQRYLEQGYLSVIDFFMFMGKTDQVGTGINTSLVDIVIDSLVEHGFVGPLDTMYGISSSGHKRFKPAPGVCETYNNGLILNKLLGFNFIIKKYAGSIVKIATNKDGKEGLGTGFYATTFEGSRKAIITNAHVIDASKFKVLLKDNTELEVLKFEKDDKTDLAVIDIDETAVKDLTPLILYPKFEILEEIITMGYPYIPLTKDNYLACHKGEINSEVQDYFGNDLFLFSAKTSSGNSGSPLINNYGVCVGITTRELYEKTAFMEMGKPPYYAAIPVTRLFNEEPNGS